MTFSQMGCHFSSVFRMIWERLKAFCAWERHWLDFFLGLFYIGILFWGQKRSWVVFLWMVFKTCSSNVLGQRWQMILMFFPKNHVFSADLPLKSTRLIHATARLRNSSKSSEHGGPAGSCPKKVWHFSEGDPKERTTVTCGALFFPPCLGMVHGEIPVKKRVDITWIWVNQNRSPSIATQPMVVVARIFCLFQSEMMVPIGKHILREGPSRNHHSVHHFTGLLVIKHGLLESPPFSSMFFPCTGAHVFFWSPSHVSLPTGISFNFVSSSRRCWIPHEVVPHSLMQKRKAPLRGSDNCV